MTEGPFDGSDLPPEDVVRPAGGSPYERGPAAGGGGGPLSVPAADLPLDPRERTAHPPPGHDHHVDEWPDHGVKPALGGFMI